MQPLTIKVNGRQQACDPGTRLDQLLKELEFVSVALAVEVNGALVPREQFDRPLAEGDQLEIVTLAGGG